jgi:acyl-CoA synthetase (AMP-forming)/AMP-acid ligase II
VVFSAQLPTNAAGKVLRRKLIEELRMSQNKVHFETAFSA